MAKTIPQYFSQVPQAVTQLPRAPSQRLADVGQGIEAQAVAGLGGVISQIGQERKNVADDLSIATAINELNEYVFNEQTALQTREFTSPDEFAIAEKDFEKNRKRELRKIATGKNPAVAARLNEYGLNSEIRDRKAYHNQIFDKQQKFNIAELNRLWGEKFQQFIDNPTELKSELTTLIEQYRPWLNPAYTQKLTNSIDSEIANYQKQTLLDNLHETAKILPFDEAISFLNDIKGVEKEERNDLITRRKRQNEIETASTDPKVYWDNLKKVTKDPRSVDDDTLGDLIKPNSLTLDDAEKIRKTRDSEDTPLKTPRAQLYYNKLDALYPDRDVEEDEAYEWDIANEKLTDYFEANPKVTAPQARDAFNEITAEKKSNFLINVLSIMPPVAAFRYFKARRKLKELEEQTFKFTAVNPDTGERMGSNDGVEWQLIEE